MAGMRRDREAALAVLGLTATATPAQITAAYRRLAHVTHPDRCPDADAAERFAALTDAYRSVLSWASQPTSAPAARSTRRPAPGLINTSSIRPGAEAIVAGPVHYVPWKRTHQHYVPWKRTHQSDAEEA